MNIQCLTGLLMLGFFAFIVLFSIRNRRRNIDPKTSARIALLGALIGAVVVIAAFYSAFYGR
jgi:cytochrome bd-type quinol oxidase subunit 1